MDPSEGLTQIQETDPQEKAREKATVRTKWKARKENPQEKKGNQAHESFKKLQFWSEIEAAIVKNDFQQAWQQRGLRTFLILVPVILMIVLPLVVFLSVMLVQEHSGSDVSAHFLSYLPVRVAEAKNFKQQAFVIFTEMLSPLCLMIVAVLTGVAAAANSFVTEREVCTLESLMLTPVDPKTLYRAKLSGCICISIIITAISFVCFMALMITANLILGLPFFLTLEWLLFLFLVIPAVSCFGSVSISCLAPRIQNTMEAFQITGYLVLAFTILYLLQFLGILRISSLFILIMALVFILSDLILYYFAAKHATTDQWLTSNFLKRSKVWKDF